MAQTWAIRIFSPFQPETETREGTSVSPSVLSLIGHDLLSWEDSLGWNQKECSSPLAMLGPGVGEGVVTHRLAFCHSWSRPQVGQVPQEALHQPWRSERGRGRTSPRKESLLVRTELACPASWPPCLWTSLSACIVLGVEAPLAKPEASPRMSD